MAPRQQLRQARFPGSAVWPGKKWEYLLFLAETNQEMLNSFYREYGR
jgi:hypothetical protein